ncbi:hypothetical protein RND81_10G007200 [Saponaria officinalis]|uniref:CCHC-type domain-containing protein n=1 Tax=Saponaria officinalis TaxID=3572 RepID=A0AAW1HXJ2_SAPOF
MVGPRGETSRGEETDAARIRRLEDAMLAFVNNVNHAGQQQQQQPAPEPRTIFEKVARHNPPTYDGVCNPVALEAWIRVVEKLFIATQCPENQKVSIATYYLQKEADNWWAISRATIIAELGFGWAQFCEALKKRFYPEELRWQKEREFLQLEQGNMSVQAYADKFIELSRFATGVIQNETARVRRFEKNVTLKVRSIVAGSPSATFQQAYDRALSVYASVKTEETEAVNRNFKRPFVPQTSYQGAKRPKFVSRQISSGGRPSGPPNTVCMRCRKSYHPGKKCDGTPMLCFKCKEPGHKAYECPKTFSIVKGVDAGPS